MESSIPGRLQDVPGTSEVGLGVTEQDSFGPYRYPLLHTSVEDGRVTNKL